MNERENLFRLVIKAGEILLHNGAEIFRVEETMTIIAKSFGVTELDVFAISNGIFMTMNYDGSHLSTQIKHIPISSVHLGRVAAVNNLSREIAAGKYTIEEALEELDKISTLPYASNSMRILFAGAGSASFGYLLGGSAADSMVAFVTGLFLYMFLIAADKMKIAKVLKNVFGSAGVTILSIALYSLGFGDSIDHIIIGAIICLVPGVAITTSVRDFFNGDYLAGTIHLVDAILVATCISVGVGVVLKAWNILF
ncbi:MAG: hypothetical protein K0S47_2941 [Herbinix sp.]|jgi:uncharacterized membrane protein YjjP (DUF1212 family)|nr:hypothetical protein [Herbinix sp.]